LTGYGNIRKVEIAGSREARSGMAQKRSLIIVESPTKARTLRKMLDRRYSVMASMGHVKDLPKSQLGVDVENGFTPKYILIKGKGPIIKELQKEARKTEAIYLATDPDREGEAICWHLSEILRPINGNIRRIEFHEVTKDAVLRALQSPREIDQNLVNAQQARRILDRLVGYNLSPLLWRKVRGGLSAGRVQSVAVRLICDREKEIESFVPQEYWTITALLGKADGELEVFRARLIQRDGERIGSPAEAGVVVIAREEEARAILAELEHVPFVVKEVRRKDQHRYPAPPFTTSTLQQEANRRLGFTATRTMAIAQQLYEGLDVGPEGTVGLITYMRTDSVRIAEEAQREIRQFITERFGPEYVPPQPRLYKSRKGAQEAHEAIRPTSVHRTPELVKPYLKPDQYKLYKLIWERCVASQMSPAVLDTLSVDITAGRYLFRATGSRVKFAGFTILYRELPEDGEEAPRLAEEEAWLPELSPGDPLHVLQVEPAQHFTQPPPRYTEASLVRALEERGIGRPSTYAPIIETIKQRGYVRVDQRRLVPTELGRLVNDLLVEHFPDIVDVGFTAAMEEQLDRIEEGQADWVEVVRSFYDPFSRVLRNAEERIEKMEVRTEEIGEPCPQCGRPLVRKHGRFGAFIACSGYPECTYTRPVGIGVTCPLCGGEIVERRSRKGRVFYGCVNYPSCTFSSWDRPSGRRCPRCGSPMVFRRDRGRGEVERCTNKACGYTERARRPVGAVSPEESIAQTS
jgi:DNA topoisomerase-1